MCWWKTTAASSRRITLAIAQDHGETKKMNRLFLLFILFLNALTALADISTPAGVINTNKGSISVNGKDIEVIMQYDSKPLAIQSETLAIASGKNPGLFISAYPDGLSSSQPFAQHIIITDATGKTVRMSNILDTGLDFQWGDNNYVLFDHAEMYFGIYSRMQFVYKTVPTIETIGKVHGSYQNYI